MTNDERAFQSVYFSISLINIDSFITKGNIYTQSIYDSTNVKFTISFVSLILCQYNLIIEYVQKQGETRMKYNGKVKVFLNK